MDMFLCFGDSLVQDGAYTRGGFCLDSAFQEYFIRVLDVINRGLCGYNTAQALAAIRRIIPYRFWRRPKIRYMLILFGSNDACTDGMQRTSLEEYGANLMALLCHSRIRSHNPIVFAVTPPPVDDISHAESEKKKGRPVLRNAENSKKYSDTARQVIQEAARVNSNIILIDLYEALKAEELNGRLDHLLPDGLHMNGVASKIFFDLVARHFEARGEDDREGYALPDFKEAPSKHARPHLGLKWLSRV